MTRLECIARARRCIDAAYIARWYAATHEMAPVWLEQARGWLTLAQRAPIVTGALLRRQGG